MRDLLLFSTYCAYMVLGLSAPFVFALGYVWTDILLPQHIAYSILRSFPIAMIMGSSAIGTYLLLDRRSPHRPAEDGKMHAPSRTPRASASPHARGPWCPETAIPQRRA